jgi:type II secretory pathway component PulK
MNISATTVPASASDAALALPPVKRASALIIVLWISFGVVSLALYFANSMNFELRASDNRVSAFASEEAIEGAIRYLTYVLNTRITYGSNGIVPVPYWDYLCQAVQVGESHFWLIGRDTNNPVGPGRMAFGLVPENARININSATSNTLYWLPRMSDDLIQALLDWRDTNGTGVTVSYYGSLVPPYACKCDHFETVDELRLLYSSTMDTCIGEDINRNGILDPNETDDNGDGLLSPGLTEYVTVYSQEPVPSSTNSDGSTNLILTLSSFSRTSLQNLLLSNNFDSSRITQILQNLFGAQGAGGGGGGGGGGGASSTNARSPLDFYIKSQMSVDEFAVIATNLTMTAATTNSSNFIQGRVNVNWASAPVLACFLNGDLSIAQSLVEYRASNPNSLGSVAWIADAMQGDPDNLSLLRARDYFTTQCYQFAADIVALGPHNRGYRRVRVVFDTSLGVTQVIYRQDLTHLGWALGKDVRENWFIANIGNQ